MSQPIHDTIAAIATPPGRGGVGMVRVSGPKVGDIAQDIIHQLPQPRYATFTGFYEADGRVIDEGLAIFFNGPNSFTGEDVLELHGHGGPVVMDMLLKRVLSSGARMAEPGEFSQRAFLNDKLDLAQAEAVADLINSGSEQAAKAASRSLQGEFSRRIHTLVEELTQLRMHVEAAIDFPEEEIDFLSDKQLQQRVQDVFDHFHSLQQTARQGYLLKEGMTVVIAGPPNAGKSSLLNRFAGYEAAIVTDIPGTTRDTLREYIHLDGMPLHIIDTAGLRESKDVVEQEGMRRTHDAIASADRVLWIQDSNTNKATPCLDPNTTLVLNKIDLSGVSSGLQDTNDPIVVGVSAKTGAGFEALVDHLKKIMGYDSNASGLLTARRRHLDAMANAYSHLESGKTQLDQGSGELMAEELRLAQQELAKITGVVTSDELLGRIFSSFCIGK